MKWISAQPATIYYAWQVEVYINNFVEKGVSPSDITVLFSVDGEIPNEIKLLQRNYPFIGFHFYTDTRLDKSYIPSIYFNAVKQHFRAYPELENEIIMFHDSDTILLKPFEQNWELLGNKSWYFSDTNSYINYDYIMQKGEDVYQRMLDIVGLDGVIPKICNSNSGGAQHLIKNSTYSFWNKVERDSIELYKMFCDTEHLYQKKHENDYPIQKWTAGMWSLLWNSWYFGNEVKVTDKLNFCWATDKIESIEGKQFLHNAGVTEDRQDLFFKGKYTNTLPYNRNLRISNVYCSDEYYKCIQRVEKISRITNLIR
jgi:hypothetical protein